MSVFGVKPIINVAGTKTRYGGALMEEEALKAMNEAANYSVNLFDLEAAAQVPPVENLYRFIDIGVDLVCFSGGKGIRGPQTSGILCGRKELICSAVMQMLDMVIESFDEWEPPTEFKLLKEKLRGRPAPF